MGSDEREINTETFSTDIFQIWGGVNATLIRQFYSSYYTLNWALLPVPNPGQGQGQGHHMASPIGRRLSNKGAPLSFSLSSTRDRKSYSIKF